MLFFFSLLQPACLYELFTSTTLQQAISSRKSPRLSRTAAEAFTLHRAYVTIEPWAPWSDYAQTVQEFLSPHSITSICSEFVVHQVVQ